jgi:hypothetical protein
LAYLRPRRRFLWPYRRSRRGDHHRR